MSDAADHRHPAPLSAAEQARVEEEVRRMVAEYRARPTQEKEDALGLEVAVMPAAEREHVTAVLLRMVAAGRGGEGPPAPH